MLPPSRDRAARAGDGLTGSTASEHRGPDAAALPRPGSEGWRRSRDALRTLAELGRERGFDVRVVLLPELHELADYPFAREHEQIAGFLHELGVPVIDLAPRFRGVENAQALGSQRD